MQPPAAVVYWEGTQPAAPGQISAANGRIHPVLTRRDFPTGKMADDPEILSHRFGGGAGFVAFFCLHG